MKTIISALCAAALLAGQAGPALGKPVEVEITAAVDFVDDPFGVLCVDVLPGDVITGTYVYDPATGDSNPERNIGDYFHQSSPFGIRLSVNGFAAETDPNNVNFLVEVVNDFDSFFDPNLIDDSFLLRSYSNLPFACGTPIEHISWQLDDFTGTALHNDNLSKKAPDLAAFEKDGNSFFGLDIFGDVDSPDGHFGFYAIRAKVISATLVKTAKTKPGTTSPTPPPTPTPTPNF